jgi:flagellar biogenesis protein FliO
VHSLLKHSTIAVFFTALTLAIPSFAAEPSRKLPLIKNQLVLGTVDGETFDQMTIINIRFNEKPEWESVPKVEDHGMFLQITLPNTLVNEPGKFFDGAPPHFPKIAIIQATPQDAAVRIFTVQPAGSVRDSSKTEILGNRLIMSLDHKKLETILGSNGSENEAQLVGPPVPPTAARLTAESVIDSTKIRTDIAAPSLVLKKETKSAALVGGGTDLGLGEKLTKVAFFSGFMFFILICTWVAKPWLKKKKLIKDKDNNPILAFETVATMPLNPKQKLMVIQVGNDRILLGVGSDSINFLTNLSGGQQIHAPAHTQISSQASKVVQALGTRKFEDTFTSNESVDLIPRPQLKNIEGNDVATLSQSSRRNMNELTQPSARASKAFSEEVEIELEEKVQSNSKRSARNTQPGSRLNIRVDDTGATKLATKCSKKQPEENNQAIDDITSIIREKLNSLRTI